MAASIAPAVAAMVRSAEAQHIAPQTIAAISARAAPSTVNSPCDVAASARINATAPAHIAKAMARLLSENPSTSSCDPPQSSGHRPGFRRRQTGREKLRFSWSCRPGAPEHDIERAAPPVARMRAADGGDPVRETRGLEPVPDRGADRPAAVRTLGFGRGGLAGNEQQHAVAAGDGLLEPAVEGVIGGAEGVAVEVDRAFGGDQAAREAAIPGGVEGVGGRRLSNRWLRLRHFCP